jgi:transcriptional regulator GlxA family with amidase domain
LAERLALQPDDAGRMRLLEAAVRPFAAGAEPVDDVGRQVWHGLARPRPLTARGLARSAGLSERQLLRRCRLAFGYGPARLNRILRIQRLLQLTRAHTGPIRLADLAAAAGHVDQQHLTHDVRAVFATTPGVLLRPPCPFGTRPGRGEVGMIVG